MEGNLLGVEKVKEFIFSLECEVDMRNFRKHIKYPLGPPNHDAPSLGPTSILTSLHSQLGNQLLAGDKIVGSFSLQKKRRNATLVAILAFYKIGRRNISSARLSPPFRDLSAIFFSIYFIYV